MHPPSLVHKDTTYSLAHLAPRVGGFQWLGQDGQVRQHSVRVRFGDHCYSREIKPPEVLGPEDVVVAQGPLRVFCPERHGYTHDLVQIVDGLLVKPTTSVALTAAEHNCHVYRLYKSLGGQDRYCVFFTLRRLPDVPAGGPTLDLFVQSAYVRTNQVKVVKNDPFGRMAEKVLAGKGLF